MSARWFVVIAAFLVAAGAVTGHLLGRALFGAIEQAVYAGAMRAQQECGCEPHEEQP